jgi:thiosulfate/3-mercaptopyruvate sulfurtransferase
MLHSCGHKNVSVLNGGLAKWQAEGRATETGDASYAPGDVSVSVDASKWSDKDDVLAAIGSGDICTLNALSAGVYSGDAEMHYGRRGHITGSRNIPYESILDEGCVRPASELKALFDAKGILAKPEIIAYCGGGISATIDALTLSLLGHENVSVYDGSMSEWVRDEDLPLTLGADEPA